MTGLVHLGTFCFLQVVTLNVAFFFLFLYHLMPAIAEVWILRFPPVSSYLRFFLFLPGRCSHICLSVYTQHNKQNSY